MEAPDAGFMRSTTRARATTAESNGRVRLADIAAKTGYSVGTVSKILNRPRGRDLFSADVSERVESAARQLGYRPNYLAQSLQTGKSRSVGLVLPLDVEGSVGGFHRPLLAGLASELVRHDHALVILSRGPGRSDWQSVGDALAQRRIDAAVAMGYTFPFGGEFLERAGSPLVLVAWAPPKVTLPAVVLDPEPGLAAAVDHLAALGHANVAWVGSSDGAESVRRLRCVRGAGRRVKVRVTAVEVPPVDKALGFAANAEAVAAALEASGFPGRTTAALCFNESHALGVYAAVAARGLRVPEDYSVVGFDDLHAEAALPPMTVVSHELEEMGRAAARMALEAARDGVGGGGRRLEVPSRLVVRKSTAAVAVG